MFAASQSQSNDTAGTKTSRILIPERTLELLESEFGMLKVFSPNGEIEEVVRDGIFTYALLAFNESRPASIRIVYVGGAASGGYLFRVTDNKLVDCAERKVLPRDVKVTWNDKGVPKLAYESDINFAFVRKNGTIRQYEAAVVTRKGNFYLSLQEVWRGKIVETKTGPAFVPTAAANAYPGVNYLQSAVGAQLILDAASARGAMAKEGSIVSAKWRGTQPELSEDLKKNGYRPAVMKWFNPSFTAGDALLADGRSCFVHMSAIVGDDGRPVLHSGGFPVLHPMQQVAIRVQVGRGRFEATSVRTL